MSIQSHGAGDGTRDICAACDLGVARNISRTADVHVLRDADTACGLERTGRLGGFSRIGAVMVPVIAVLPVMSAVPVILVLPTMSAAFTASVSTSFLAKPRPPVLVIEPVRRVASVVSWHSRQLDLEARSTAAA